MKLLRQMIRQLLLEGPVKDSFDEAWHNTDEERSQFPDYDGDFGTMHPDQLRKAIANRNEDIDDDDVKELFKNKRDLKRLWNETIDDNNLRSFWEGPKMKYFHSLAYYGSPKEGEDYIAKGVQDDSEVHDLTAWGFFQMYDKTGNKDEMSTYGVYKNKHQIPTQQTKFGVVIFGRLTLATMNDSFTGSRLKPSDKHIATHSSSGMPKRIMPTDDKIQSLLFEEEDIIYFNNLGECILDNWSIEAIVCSTSMSDDFIDAAQELADQYGVPLIPPKEMGQRGHFS